jgi:hypothetical protein
MIGQPASFVSTCNTVINQRSHYGWRCFFVSPPIESTASELRQSGPWILTERISETTHKQEQLAATPAAEDGNLWLVLVCNDTEITASLMHSREFPSNVLLAPKLVLRSEGFPVVAVSVQVVQRNQLSLDPATARHLMALIVVSEKMIVSIGQSDGTARDYSFSLQPNDPALAEIGRHCLGEKPMQHQK